MMKRERCEWISVSENTPSNENWVRVCLDGEPSVIPCCFNGIWYEYGNYASYIPPVTHCKPFDDIKPCHF